MDFSVFYLPALLLLLGLLALKLPRRFNPFQLKSAYARHASEQTQDTIPKVIGWLLIGIGSLWIVGILALFLLFKYADTKKSNTAEDAARRHIMEERETVDNLNHLIKTADSYSILSKKGNRFITSAKQETSNLEELQQIFQLNPRENLNQALIVFPHLAINFDNNGKTTAQLKFSISHDGTAYSALDAVHSKTTQGTLNPTQTNQLLEILRKHDEKNLKHVLEQIIQPDPTLETR